VIKPLVERRRVRRHRAGGETKERKEEEEKRRQRKHIIRRIQIKTKVFYLLLSLMQTSFQ
jgi:hypothetical protein